MEVATILESLPVSTLKSTLKAKSGTAKTTTYSRTLSTADFSLLTVTQILGRLGVRLACFFGYCNNAATFLQVTENMVNKDLDSDPFLHLYMVVAYVPQLDLLLGSSCPVHSAPAKDPAIFSDFKTSLTLVYATNHITNLTRLSKEIDSGYGWRQAETYLCKFDNLLIKADNSGYR